ncbi:MAG: hypothetical protein KF813_03850 [Trueperaceae bacterium]|nr:hypothetical protein [Trueperaceae bacterium]
MTRTGRLLLAGLLGTCLLAACGTGTNLPPGGGDSKPAAASSGVNHSLVLTTDGRVLAWGYQDDGVFGTCTTSTPTFVEGLADIVAVAAGNRHALALAQDGSIHVYGSNASGQLGRVGGNTCTPVKLDIDATFTSIAAARETSFALDDEGGLWAWGGNDRYLLGDGTSTNRTVPQKVAGLPAVVSIGVGESAVFALTTSSGVWAWGQGHAGSLGTGDSDHQTSPVRITALDEYEVVQVSPGYLYGMALLADGTVVGWGDNIRGQLGMTPGTPATVLEPVAVPGLEDVEALTTGPHTVVAIVGGVPFTFGANPNGELGLGSHHDNLGTPTAVALANVVSVAMGKGGALSAGISAGGVVSSALAVHADGSVSGWGYNPFGQVKAGEPSKIYTPVGVVLP